MIWLREVKTVGILNWLWFVVYLKRDDCSPKLDIMRYYPDMDSLNRDRRLAHNIDCALSDLGRRSR